MSVEVKDLREVAAFNEREAAVKELFKTVNIQVELLCVGSGQFVSPRIADISDTFFWVLDGEAIFEAGDVVLVLTDNTGLMVSAGDSVGIINESNNALTVLRVTGPVSF